MGRYFTKREDADYATTSGINDITWTVPSGKIARVPMIHVSFTASATVGTRNIDIEFRDDADVVIRTQALGSVAASATGTWNLYDGSADGDIPDWPMLEGWDIRVFDNAGIDGTSDAVSAKVLYEESVEDETS